MSAKEANLAAPMNRSNGGQGTKYHLVASSGGAPKCGAAAFLDYFYYMPARAVDHTLRCRRCKGWPS